MKDRMQSIFLLDASSIQLFSALGLDGQAASAYTAIHACGISAFGEDKRTPLLLCGTSHSAGVAIYRAQR